MKNILFEEVGMQNYGPYIEPMILKFPLNNITMITGPNGIGKTTALDAIPFTLFGITSKGMKGDDLVNNTVKRNCHTWVKFSINTDQYEVDRWQKGTKQGNTVSLKKNGVEMYRGAKEVVPEVERILCSAKAFMNTLMFGQKIKDFFTDLVDSEKKEIFRKILDLDIYLKYYAKADEILKSLRPLVDKTKGEISLNEGLISDANSNIFRLNKEKEDFQVQKQQSIAKEKESLALSLGIKETHENQIKELSKNEYEVEQLIVELSTLQAELDSIEQTKKSSFDLLQSKRSEKNKELEGKAGTEKAKIFEEATVTIRKIRDELSNEISLLSVDVERLTKETTLCDAEIRAQRARAGTLDKDIIELKESINKDVCPTCNQPIGDECKALVNKKVDEKNSIILSIEDKVTVLIEKLSGMRSELEAKKKEVEALRIKMSVETTKVENDRNTKVEEIDNKLRGLLGQVTQIFYAESAKLGTESDSRKDELKKLIASLKEKIEARRKIKNQIDAVTRCINDTERVIEMHQREIDRLEKSEYDEKQIKLYVEKRFALTRTNQKLEQEIESTLKKIDITQFWKDAYSPSGIPSMLIDEAIPFMNSTIAGYLEKFGGRYIVSFDTLAATKSGEMRDKISVNVLDTFTKANSRVQLSGGQTRLLDIATILTLGDLQSNIKDFKTNILIFDEIFDALDDENIEYVAKVLQQIKQERCIYIISHRHVDQVEADEVLALR